MDSVRFTRCQVSRGYFCHLLREFYHLYAISQCCFTENSVAQPLFFTDFFSKASVPRGKARLRRLHSAVVLLVMPPEGCCGYTHSSPAGCPPPKAGRFSGCGRNAVVFRSKKRSVAAGRRKSTSSHRAKKSCGPDTACPAAQAAASPDGTSVPAGRP